MKIVILCRSLDYGGAERQAILLARGLAARGHAVALALFYRGGPLEAGLAGTDLRVHDLAKRGRWDALGFFVRLVRFLRRERPDIVYGFLPVPNLVAALAKAFVRTPRLVFGVRAAGMDLAHYDWLARLSYRLEAQLSSRADLVIANSEEGARDIARRGFRARKVAVVANGIDTENFARDPAARLALRRDWGVPEGAFLVGHAGRLDPMKGHDLFLEAAANLARDDAGLRFVSVGAGDRTYLARLKLRATSLELEGRLIWAGGRADMARCYAALDLFCSSSRYGEGFPNVVAEAMACGVPCVATDLGAARAIVGELGLVVPPGDASALAKALATMIGRVKSEGPSLAASTRRSIETRFGVVRLAAETEALLRDLA
ncbi:MAG TPA: glycosyltransferase [Alphaproteobacteria bacterium]|nr:glycosyltransferase [Alphaproteobacteria bacterium]